MNRKSIKQGRKSSARKYKKLMGAAAAGVLLQAAPALAQQADAGLEVVVVTAQRRAEKLQDVPVAVKAFSAKQIDDTGIKNTQDFMNLTPNVSFDNSYTYNNSFVVMRGMTQINNADSPVAVVVDGVPQNDQKQLKMSLFDMERIEVLKGPQGALYGRNAIGGAIVIDTKQPKNKFEGFVHGDVGNGNTKELSGGVSGAIVPDKVLFRVVGQTKSSDGLNKNTYLNKNVDYIDHDNSVRAKLMVLASDNVTLDFRVSSQDFKAGAEMDSILRDGDPNKFVSPTSNLYGQSTGKSDEFTFKADVVTGIGTLTAITGHTKLTTKDVGDLDFTNLGNPLGGIIGPFMTFNAAGVPNCLPPTCLAPPLFQGQLRNVDLTSQEIRLTSPANQPARWIGGLFYLDSKRTMDQRSGADFTSSLAQWDAASSNPESYTSKATAVFGQLDYDLSAATTLSGALRYDRDARTRSNVRSGVGVAETFDAWQPKLTLTRRFDADSIGYATYSTGFRSGGFNSTQAGFPGYKAEMLRNYEAGYKSSLLNKRLTFNAAAFYSKSTDFQYFYVKILPDNSGAQVIGNIDKVDIKGLDLDLRFAPVKGLELDAGLGLTNSIIKANASAPSSVGNHTPKNSPWKLNLGAQYSAPIAAGMQGFGRLDIEERSKKYWHPDNALVSDGFALIGARVGVREEKDKWSMYLYGRNLTDKHYYADVNGRSYSGWPGNVGAIGSLAPPRSFGLEANFRI